MKKLLLSTLVVAGLAAATGATAAQTSGPTLVNINDDIVDVARLVNQHQVTTLFGTVQATLTDGAYQLSVAGQGEFVVTFQVSNVYNEQNATSTRNCEITLTSVDGKVFPTSDRFWNCSKQDGATNPIGFTFANDTITFVHE